MSSSGVVPPGVVLAGASSFVATLVAHVFLWRAIRPRASILPLVVVMLVLPGIAWAIAFVERPNDWPLAAWALGALIHVALAAAYIMSYPAAQAVSPTLAMLVAIDDCGPDGMTEESLAARFDLDPLDGLADALAADGLARRDGSRLTATPRGLWLARVFRIYRRVLGLPEGGG